MTIKESNQREEDNKNIEESNEIIQIKIDTAPNPNIYNLSCTGSTSSIKVDSYQSNSQSPRDAVEGKEIDVASIEQQNCKTFIRKVKSNNIT